MATSRRQTVPRNAQPLRNQKIYELAQKNPDLTYEQIGERYGIGRSRVCKIIKQIEKKNDK